MSENKIPEYPQVSCIMPTFNRRQFVPQAIKYFLEQDYPYKQLIIVDDGHDRIEDLVPQDSQITYIPFPRKITIGEKRNLAIEHSQSDIILHWDDDDWQARNRISYQMKHLLKHQADICGTHKLLFYDLRSGKQWLYEYPSRSKKWLAGATLCYRRSFWIAGKFDHQNIGEDTRFVWKNLNSKMLCLPDYHFYVAIIHHRNVCPKSLSGSYWKSYKQMEIANIMHEDWAFYANLIQQRKYV